MSRYTRTKSLLPYLCLKRSNASAKFFFCVMEHISREGVVLGVQEPQGNLRLLKSVESTISSSFFICLVVSGRTIPKRSCKLHEARENQGRQKASARSGSAFTPYFLEEKFYRRVAAHRCKCFGKQRLFFAVFKEFNNTRVSPLLKTSGSFLFL